jgi:broad specificity phosphatase PhoE
VPGRIVLVRHAESEGNAARSFTRSPEVPLTERGWEQARESAVLLAKDFEPERLVSSPFRRARQTAEAIAERLALRVEIEAGVREQHFGELHGEPYEAARSSPGFAELPRWEWRPPGGETLLEVRDRAVPVIEQLAGAHAEGTVVVVSHGGTIFALWSWLVGRWESARSLGNAERCVITHDGREFSPPVLPG